MSQGSVLKVRLSLKGRPIRSFTFSQKEVVIGRDPESDIFLDNAGVSRNHARFELTPAGYVVEDLGSANGTYLNDELVTKKRVADDDIVRVGKFALWLNLGEDQRTRGADKKLSPTMNEGTVVLSNMQLDRMLNSIKANEEQVALEPEPVRSSLSSFSRTPVSSSSKKSLLWAVSAALLAGLAIGTLVAWVLLNRTPSA